MREPTEITITIDTECNIAGAFTNPEKYKPISEQAILCEVGGKEQGVGFMLETFEQYGITASFFIECAQYFYFGDEPMRSVAKRILAAGQDAQLHVHPCWMSYNDDEGIGIFPVDDSCKGRNYDELRKIFEISIDIFARWTGRRPDAIRTGNLLADTNIYKVMKDLAIPLASNVGVGVNLPSEPKLNLYGGRSVIEGVMELPVFTYRDMNLFGKQSIKSLQINSCSWLEMKYLLLKARAEGVENIVILTHPFEFIKKSDPFFTKMARNRVNQERLEKLCRFISEHDQDFISAGFGDSRDKWLQKGPVAQEIIDIPSYYMMGRKLHNKLNDTIWSY